MKKKNEKLFIGKKKIKQAKLSNHSNFKKCPPKPSVSTEITIAPLALVFEYNCCYK